MLSVVHRRVYCFVTNRIKRDIARWLQAKLSEMETRAGLGGQELGQDGRAVLRRLARKNSRREGRAAAREAQHGTLRRAHSAELVSEIGEEDEQGEPVCFILLFLNKLRDIFCNNNFLQVCDEESFHVYHGLTIGNKPRLGGGADGGRARLKSPPTRTRVRHNSDGNYDDVSLMQETILSAQGGSEGGSDNRLYQNLGFHQQGLEPGLASRWSTEPRLRVPLSGTAAVELVGRGGELEPLAGRGGELEPEQRLAELLCGNTSPRQECSTDSGGSGSCSLASLQSCEPGQCAGRPGLVGLPLTSDTGSLDSHNDSGYSTRLGVSDGASPSLSASSSRQSAAAGRPSSPLLDPQAIYMIPSEWETPSQQQLVSKSSLV